MAVIPLPTIAKFDNMDWRPMFRNQVNKSAWSGNRKVMGLPGGESFAVSCGARPVTTMADERLWRAFLMKLRGAENHFNIVAACNQFTAATTNPSVSSAIAGNSFATLANIPTGGMKAGMFMTFSLTGGGKQLVCVTADTAAGTQVVSFEPSLRKNGTGSVEVKNPYCEVAMTRDDSGWNVQQGTFTISFEAEEAF